MVGETMQLVMNRQRTYRVFFSKCALWWLVLLAGWMLPISNLWANEVDHRIASMLIGEWTISGAVDDNISGTGRVRFANTGLADYSIEVYLNDYLLDRIESVFNWSVQQRYLQMTESEHSNTDPYGLRARARKEPVKVISISEKQLVLETQNYGVLVLQRSGG